MNNPFNEYQSAVKVLKRELKMLFREQERLADSRELLAINHVAERIKSIEKAIIKLEE